MRMAVTIRRGMSLDDFAVGTRALTGLLEIFLSESVLEGAGI